MKKKILIVDDDQSIREMLEKFLKQGGFQVLIAQNSEEGLAIMGSTDIDLVITDVVMPETIGLVVAEEAIIRKIPVIVISGGFRGIIGGVEPQEYLSIAKRCGATATFEKPLKLNKLLETIHELLAPTPIKSLS